MASASPSLVCGSPASACAEVSEWKSKTAKSLIGTAPFDASTATVLFVAEGQLDSRLDYCRRHEGYPQPETINASGSLTGDEARSFYEEVVSNSQNHTTGDTSNKRKPSREERVRSRKRTRSQVPSVSQVFRYAQEGDLEQLREVVESNLFDVNSVDNFGWTLLMSSASAGRVNIVHWLLTKGAVWRGVTDRKGYDAPTLARHSGYEAMARMIEEFHWFEEQRCEHVEPQSVKMEPFYCDVCKQTVHKMTKSVHNSSTVHQFSCQHRPGVPGYAISQSNRGFQMMLRSGWDPDRGLGCEGQGRQFPVKTVLKYDRHGLGVPPTSEQRPRVTHFAANDVRAVRRKKRPRLAKTVVELQTNKKERKKALGQLQERGWEIRMRRYMNTD